MKDFVSKATFGFLMAQFIPGAIAVLGISLVLAAITGQGPNSVSQQVIATVESWGGSVVMQLLVVGLFTGAGMLIHGLHWSVLGYLERTPRADNMDGPNPVFETFWHDKRIALQVLLGPVKLLRETVQFLFNGTSVRNVSMNENIHRVDPKRIDAFVWVQDFYLHFSQFYAHAAFAFVPVLMGLLAFTARFGFTWQRLSMLAIAWLLTGMLFIVGRVQLASMFIAEQAVADAGPA